jgi:hypothetical protein
MEMMGDEFLINFLSIAVRFMLMDKQTTLQGKNLLFKDSIH